MPAKDFRANPLCRLPVRVLGGTVDLVVNNALQSFLAVQMTPGARFDWVPGIGHMLHHFMQHTVVEAVCGLHCEPEFQL